MTQRVNLNGRLIPDRDAKISVYDSAYLYGEGVFETLLVQCGKPIFLAQHLTRLFRSIRILQFSFPFSLDRLKKEVIRTIRVNRWKEAPLRIQISAQDRKFGFAIFRAAFKPYPQKLYQRGARLILVHSVVNDPWPLVTIKTTNFLTKMVARREIQRRRADEGLLLNSAGRITEGASSNFFVVQQGRLLTPPIEEGLLPGITRQKILQLAKKMRIPTGEAPLTVSAIRKAKEIFIVSSLKGVMPIRWFEGIRKVAPGPMTQRISVAYQSLLRIQPVT